MDDWNDLLPAFAKGDWFVYLVVALIVLLAIINDRSQK